MADAHKLIEYRIDDLSTILRYALTPLLRQQIREAIALHRDAAGAPNLNPYLEDLNARYAEIKKHWAKLSGDMVVATAILRNICLFGEFLAFELLEDYTNQPYSLSNDMLAVVDVAIKERTHPRDKEIGSTAYHKNITFLLEEMALNTPWVEKKLSTVAARRGRSGDDIQPLINEHDWPQLAVTLLSDRELAARLMEESFCSQELYERVAEGITHIQTRYFEKLRGPTEYTLSTHAAPLKGQTPPVGRRNILSRVMAHVWSPTEGRPRVASGDSEKLKKIS